MAESGGVFKNQSEMSESGGVWKNHSAMAESGGVLMNHSAMAESGGVFKNQSEMAESGGVFKNQSEMAESEQQIPTDLWDLIVSKCNILERARLSHVCKNFRNIARRCRGQESNQFESIKWANWSLPVNTPVVEVIDFISWEVNRKRHEMDPDAVKLGQDFAAVNFLQNFLTEYGSLFSSDPRYWKLEIVQRFCCGKFQK